MGALSAGWQRRAGLAVLALSLLAGLGWQLVRTPADATGPRPGWQRLAPPDDVNALAMFEGLVLAGGRDGLVALDPANAAPRQLSGGTPAMTYVKALLVDRSGALWVGHRSGLARYAQGSWHRLPVSPGAPPGPVSALLETADGTLLAGGEAGLARVVGDTLVAAGLPAARAGQGVSALLQDSAGRLWVGFGSATRGGLLLRDSGGWHEIGLAHGLAHLAINQITQNSAGQILLATGFSGRGGACTLARPGDLTSWACLGEADGLASDMVRLMQEDGYGQLWIGSEFHGATVRTGGASTLVGPGDGMAGTELKALLEDPLGNLWLGCDKGLTRIAAAHAVLAQ